MRRARIPPCTLAEPRYLPTQRKESDVPLDLEEESRRLWSEYHAAREAGFAGYDFNAVSLKLRSLRRRSSKAAVADEGMLVLSAEHEALIERGRLMLGRLHAAAGGRSG